MELELKVVELVRDLVLQKQINSYEFKEKDWSNVFSIACRNNIAPFLFEEVARINEDSPIDEVIMQQWKQYTMQTSLTEYQKGYALRKIIRMIKEKGGKLCWIKTT